MKNVFLRRVLILVVVLIIAFWGGRELWEIRHFKQSIVVSEDFTEKVMLSDYFEGIKGTWVDTPVYIYDSG
ncbi:MAG TPA: deacylase, partial [Atribacterota bacterium]|nr:deacylase [Atribacterota bacterium]